MSANSACAARPDRWLADAHPAGGRSLGRHSLGAEVEENTQVEFLAVEPSSPTSSERATIARKAGRGVLWNFLSSGVSKGILLLTTSCWRAC